MRLVLLWGIVGIFAPFSHTHATAQPEIPPPYELVAENDAFQLYVDSSTLAFKLVNKRSGYLWHSGIDDPQDGDRLNSSWRAFAKSGISIQYLDKRATDSRASLTNSEHTLSVHPIEQGISADLAFTKYGIHLQVQLQLEADGVRVAIPALSIREENPEYRLAKVLLYPFLGATRGSSIKGYMFLPDGIGSLVDYADTTKATNMFYGRYYGADLGILGAMPYRFSTTPPMPISYPVFGAVHEEGQNAFLSVVEKGASYGEVHMHPAGIITNFNFIYNAFIYNETYFQATNRSGAGITTVQRNTNSFDAIVHYRFLTGDSASYVGMAHSYQHYLLDNGLLPHLTATNPNIGIRLEFLGGDKEQVVLWHRFIPMTTIPQINATLDSLAIPNPQVIYYGWQPLGATTMPPPTLSIESSLGDVNALNTLANRLSMEGGSFALYLEPQVAIWGEGGYSTRHELAMAITNVAIEGYGRTYSYYFTQEALQSRFLELAHSLTSYPAIGLALDEIGSILYSDFRNNPPFNREQTIHAYQALLQNSPVSLALYSPNDYLWQFAHAYYDMPLGDNGYSYTTRTVPFLPIVLSGYMPYYGSPLNFSSNHQDDLLRHVEYGIYPSYFITQEPTANMINTRSSWIYTSAYAQWGEHIRSTYAWMNALLAPVHGQAIVSHAPLTTGVFVTTYANGKQIIVNYTDSPVPYQGVIIPAKDALLVEGGL